MITYYFFSINSVEGNAVLNCQLSIELSVNQYVKERNYTGRKPK